MISESSCVDNFTIPQGPQGPRGATGIQGSTGPKGDTGIQGNVGPSGGNKIDIHLREGNTPYVNITSLTESGEQALCYFIFPGTSTFTPNSFKVGISSHTALGTVILSLNLYKINTNSTKTIVSSISTSLIEQSGDIFQVVSSST